MKKIEHKTAEIFAENLNLSVGLGVCTNHVRTNMESMEIMHKLYSTSSRLGQIYARAFQAKP